MERNVGGRPPRASRETVVAAGLDVLKTEGLSAVTLAAVGDRLGLGKVALYTYVSSKDDLLRAMRDEVDRRQLDALRADRDLPPDVALKAVCARLVDLVADYGQLLVALEPDLTGAGLDVGERFLEILARLGLTPHQQLQVYLLLSSAVHGLVTSIVPSRPIRDAQADGPARGDLQRFPRLTSLYADAAVTATADPKKLVEEVVSLIVDVLVPALRDPGWDPLL